MEESENKTEKFQTGEQPFLSVREKMQNRKKESEQGISVYIAAMMILIGMIGLGTIFYVKGNQKIGLLEPILGEGKQATFFIGEIAEDKSKLRIISISSKEQKELASKVLTNASYKNMEDMLKDFLKPFENKENYPTIALLGVPGVIKDNVMYKTRTFKLWGKIEGEKIQKELNIKQVKLVNINVFNGYGIKTDLKEGTDYIVLNGKQPNGRFNKVVIEPAYSVGVSLLQVCKAQNGNYRVIESDAGFIEPQALTERIRQDFGTFAYGTSGQDKAKKSMAKSYIRNVGEFSSKIGLAYLPFGGIYITGEYPRNIKDLFKIEEFNKTFFNFVDYKEVLEEFPIVLVLNENIKSIGAVEYAKEMLA